MQGCLEAHPFLRQTFWIEQGTIINTKCLETILFAGASKVFARDIPTLCWNIIRAANRCAPLS